jgi:hypothetical protein
MLDESKDEIFEEDVIIKPLLKFNEFERFYCEQRYPKKKDTPIIWKINDTSDVFACFDFDDKPFIRLKQYPKTLNDAFLVSHELMHSIMYFMGQYVIIETNPLVFDKHTMDNIKRLENELLSMVDDPLVDSYLQDNYGFKPAIFYTTILIPEAISSLRRFGDARNEFERFRYGVVYAQRALQWDSIKNPNSRRKWEDLKTLYKKIRPTSLKIGDDLYSMAKEIGYDTPEKQKKFLTTIFEQYTIDDGTKMIDYMRVQE